MREKREKTQVTNTRDRKGGITTDSTDSTRIIRDIMSNSVLGNVDFKAKNTTWGKDDKTFVK